MLILIQFVSICGLGLPRPTYTLPSVLFIKFGVTNWYQSSADCRTLNLVRNGQFYKLIFVKPNLVFLLLVIF